MQKQKPMGETPLVTRLSKNSIFPSRVATMSQLFTERVAAIRVAKMMSVPNTLPTLAWANCTTKQIQFKSFWKKPAQSLGLPWWSNCSRRRWSGVAELDGSRSPCPWWTCRRSSVCRSCGLDWNFTFFFTNLKNNKHVFALLNIGQVEFVELLEFQLFDHLPIGSNLDWWLSAFARLAFIEASSGLTHG